MEFTPQQLRGSGKYNHGVLIGNWNEDRSLEDVKSKSTLRKKELGIRYVDKKTLNVSSGELSSNLSYSEDGYVRYGFMCQLRHSATQKLLGCNLAHPIESDVPGVYEFQSSGVAAASGRTSFMILPANGTVEDKEFLEYGDEILLATNPELRVNEKSGLYQYQFYLMSSSQSVMGSSSHSGNQEVRVAQVLTSLANRYLRWRIEPLHITTKSHNKDKRVRSFEHVQLVHCATGRSLAMEKDVFVYNDFGKELDVFCCLDQRTNRVHVMNAENRGLRIGDDRVRVQDRNAWVLEISTEEPPSTARDFEGDEEGKEEKQCQSSNYSYITPQAVLELTFSQVYMLDGGLDSLREHLERLDTARDGILDRITFKYALVDAGIDLSEDEFSCLLDCFENATSSTTGIKIEEFIGAMTN